LKRLHKQFYPLYTFRKLIGRASNASEVALSWTVSHSGSASDRSVKEVGRALATSECSLVLCKNSMSHSCARTRDSPFKDDAASQASEKSRRTRQVNSTEELAGDK
jgi:hypothetical protein